MQHATVTEAAFRRLFDPLAVLGRDPATGGYARYAWTPEDAAARRWFRGEAERLGLGVRMDRNGNLWAWWGDAGPGAVVTGSHLDTVPQGGAYDGALGIVCAFAAVEALAARGFHPTRPVAVVAFADEEGARFGVATFGSRLLTGALTPAEVLDREDGAGTTVAAAMRAAGVDPGGLGADTDLVSGIACFVELHVEQGRALAPAGVPLGIGTGIWPHGRWRLTLRGEPNHAGTTVLADRRDPALGLAAAITAAREQARAAGAVATIGRLAVAPNGANVIPSRADAWLDARAADDASLDALVEAVCADVREVAADNAVDVEVVCESRSAAVRFDTALAERLAGAARASGVASISLPTAAGHDAGVLAADVPSGMLFVRNPTGASHSPAEGADDADCAGGASVLAAVLEDLSCR